MTVTRTVAPYRVVDSGRTREEIYAFLHDQHYRGYGSDYRHGGTGKVVVGCLYDFERLIARLVRRPGVEFVNHVDLLAEPCPPDRIRVGIRHDVDTDIDAGLVQAEIEHAYGVVANWVILHTAWYYGTMEDGVFHRNEAMADVYRRFQDLGHEVSLHTDPLLLYQDYGVDGAEAVVTELAWLRSLGLDVRGTTAHNHRPRYGAVNYEVFKGYAAPSDTSDATEVVHDGKWAPILYGHGVDPNPLTLDYKEVERMIEDGYHVVKLAMGGKEQPCQFKDAQWDHLGKHLIHVDMLRVDLNERVSVNVPIEYRGTAPGVSEGGVMHHELNQIEIECMVSSIPETIRVDVSEMKLDDVMHVRDVKLPDGMTHVMDEDAVVATVKLPTVVEEPVAVEGEEGEVAEPEVIAKGKEKTEEEED